MSQHKKNGAWYIKCYNPTTKKSTTIRKNPKTNKPFQSKKEAKEFELYYLKNKIDINMKFDTLFRLYIDYLNLKPNSSATKVECWYKNNIRKAVGNKKIISIRISDLENISRNMLKENYSVNYINKMTAIVKTVLNYGVTNGFIERNPVSGYKPLKNIKVSEDIKYWTPLEIKQILDGIPLRYKRRTDQKTIYFMIKLAFLTGLRKGELRATQWYQIDFKNNIFHVDYHINDKGKRIKGRKNGNGYSFVMDDLTKNLLDEMYKYYSKIEGFNKYAYIFPSFQEGFIYPIGDHTPTRWIEQLSEFCKLPNITFHGLRHSTCSYWVSVIGLTPYECADKLGDTVEVVLSVYANFFTEAKLTTANKINQHSDMLERILDSKKIE